MQVYIRLVTADDAREVLRRMMARSDCLSIHRDAVASQIRQRLHGHPMENRLTIRNEGKAGIVCTASSSLLAQAVIVEALKDIFNEAFIHVERFGLEGMS